MRNWRDRFAHRLNDIIPPCQQMSKTGYRDFLAYAIVKRCIEARRAEIYDALEALGCSLKTARPWADVHIDSEMMVEIEKAHPAVVAIWKEKWPHIGRFLPRAIRPLT